MPDHLSARPARAVAVVACMDCRLDPLPVLGLSVGDAHVLRNAGGVVTEDVIRSLVVSQTLLGTTEIVLVHHTECGMRGLDEAALAERLETETGTRPDFAFAGFADAEQDVRTSMTRLRAVPWLHRTTSIRGHVWDVGTGELRTVS